MTDKEVERTIDEGAESLDEVTRACGAGGDCGSCCKLIEQIIDEKRLARERAA